MTIPTQTTNPPLQVPTVDVTGKVVYQGGPWGSKYPARKISANLFVTDHPSGTINFAGNSLGDDKGKFRVKSGVITSAFSRITLQIHEDFTGQDFDLVLFPGLIGPNQGPQDIGEIVFPFDPEHPELAVINSRSSKDTQDIAKTLAGILRSNDKRVSIDLLSEWRGTESIPVDQLADDRLPRVTEVNGKVYKNPVSKGTQEERRQGKREDERFIRERLKQFKPIPILTPAQILLKTLYMAGFAKDFPQSLVKDMFSHSIVPGNPGTTVDSIAAILDHFSLAKIFHLESGDLLKRIVNSLQRAGNARFHFDTVLEEAAADMSAACATIFLAGFMAKHNVQPQIIFNYWHQFSLGNGFTETRPYVKISIIAAK